MVAAVVVAVEASLGRMEHSLNAVGPTSVDALIGSDAHEKDVH